MTICYTPLMITSEMQPRSRESFTSKITPIILGEVGNIDPSRVEEIGSFMHDIDQQGIENFKLFERPDGSKIPYTSIDVTKLAVDHFARDHSKNPNDLTPDPKSERLTYFLFTGHHPSF